MYPQRSVMTCGLATALEPPYFNHAPVWGRRFWEISTLFVFSVSIHAPAWGATCPRLLLLDLGLSVSIHAPAWGATADLQAAATEMGGFNPRTRVGCDSRRTWPKVASCSFQSTHPRGVRL